MHLRIVAIVLFLMPEFIRKFPYKILQSYCELYISLEGITLHNQYYNRTVSNFISLRYCVDYDHNSNCHLLLWQANMYFDASRIWCCAYTSYFSVLARCCRHVKTCICTGLTGTTYEHTWRRLSQSGAEFFTHSTMFSYMCSLA